MSEQAALDVRLGPEASLRTRWAAAELLARLRVRYQWGLHRGDTPQGLVLALGCELPLGSAGTEILGAERSVDEFNGLWQAGGRIPLMSLEGERRTRIPVFFEGLMERWLAWRPAHEEERPWAEDGRSREGTGEAHDLRVGRRPYADLLAELVYESLNRAASASGNLPLARVSRWPGGRQFSIHLSHDVDYIDGRSMIWARYASWAAHAGVALARGQIGTAGTFLGRIRRWVRTQGDPQAGVPILMKLEDELGARSTFYFIAKASSYSVGEKLGRLYNIHDPSVRRVVAEVAHRGWEVGVHGRYPTYTDPSALRRERRLLEEAAGRRVVGVRQHCLHLRFPETFRAQRQAGFEYDATVGWNDDVGFRGRTCLPYRLWDSVAHRPLDLWELPLTFQDCALAASVGPVSSWMDALATCRRDVERVEGVLGVSLHPNWVDPVEFPGALDFYRDLLADLRDRGGWLVSGQEIIASEDDYRDSLNLTSRPGG